MGSAPTAFSFSLTKGSDSVSWISEAHNEWHAVNGRDAICPLDCFDPPEPEGWYESQPQGWDDDPSPYAGTYSEG